MINPLIHRHPADTLHCVYSVLDFLETFPGEGREDITLNHTQTFGLFCVFECLKGALQFEGDRASTVVPPDLEAPHAAAVVRRLKTIKHPVLRRRVLLEVERVVGICVNFNNPI